MALKMRSGKGGLQDESAWNKNDNTEFMGAIMSILSQSQGQSGLCARVLVGAHCMWRLCCHP